jgi:metal-responsive CopG/Arc/MetJ family transcriptional regulator
MSIGGDNMAKKTVTISISVPEELVEEIDRMANDLNVSRSSFATALFCMSLKWIYKAKEVIKDGI